MPSFAVIFDMDGTLLDTQRICIPAWEYAGRLQGICGAGDDIPHVCGMNPAGWMGYLRRKYPTLDAERFRVDSRAYIAEHLTVRYKKGAPPLLDFLKENAIPLALASGSSRASVTHHIEAVHAEAYFSAFVYGDEPILGKPAPDIFLAAAERLHLPPERCFVFEDSENGIRAAFAAGMKPIGIPDVAPFSPDTKELLYAELKSLDEAIPLLEALL